MHISTGWSVYVFWSHRSRGLCIRAMFEYSLQETGGLFVGDVHLFNGDELVAICAGLRFQELPKTTLHGLLHQTSPQFLEKSNRHLVGSSGSFITTSNNEDDDMAFSAFQKKKFWELNYKSSLSHAATYNEVLQSGAVKGMSLVTHPLNAMDILAEEVGIQEYSLMDDTVFRDLGIDSLLSISLTKTMKAKLDLSIDFQQ